MIRLIKTNHYVANYVGRKSTTCMYQGYAESEEQFRDLCNSAGYDLDGLQVECIRKDARDEMGRTIEPTCNKE